MRKPEQLVWQAFKGAAPPGLWMQRVENQMVEGMPDVFVACPVGRQAWVELKVGRNPARSDTPILGEALGLRQEQKNWHTKFHELGGRSYILIRTPDHSLFFVRGQFADEINKANSKALRELSIAKTWLGIFIELKENA